MKKKLYVSRSSLHGKGLFAKENIKKGDYLGEYLGVPTNRNSKYVLWIDELGLLVKNEMKYINHSCFHNSELTKSKCYAIKNIKKDAEITIYYSDEYNNYFKV